MRLQPQITQKAQTRRDASGSLRSTNTHATNKHLAALKPFERFCPTNPCRRLTIGCTDSMQTWTKEICAICAAARSEEDVPCCATELLQNRSVTGKSDAEGPEGLERARMCSIHKTPKKDQDKLNTDAELPILVFGSWAVTTCDHLNPESEPHAQILGVPFKVEAYVWQEN